MELQTEKRFHNLTHEQLQALDKVLTEVIPIHGRGNFPTLEVRAKDIIRVVKDRLIERDIQVKDIRLNGATASHVMVRDNGMGYRDLDIIFGVELPRQEDFQVIKEVVLGSLRDLLPCGVNRRKITCLTMKEAYVQKMVKVFNEHDRWSLISLSNNRAKTVGLRFVSSLRRQFEFSVDSFQIILDRMLESYWESDRKNGGKFMLNNENLSNLESGEEKKEQQQPTTLQNLEEDIEKDSVIASSTKSPCQSEEVTVPGKDLSHPEVEHENGKHEAQQVLEIESAGLHLPSLQDEEEVDGIEDVHLEEDIMFEICEENVEEKEQFHGRDYPSVSSPKTLLAEVRDPLVTNTCLKLQSDEEELSESQACNPSSTVLPEKSAPPEIVQCEEMTQFTVDTVIHRTDSTSGLQDSRLEFASPPPAKKTCSTSHDIIPDYCPSPKLQRKMSRKMISKPTAPEKWSLLTDLSDLTTQLFPPIEIPKTVSPKPPLSDSAQTHCCSQPSPTPKASEGAETLTVPACSSTVVPQNANCSTQTVEQIVKPKQSKKPPDSKTESQSCTADVQPALADKKTGQTVKDPNIEGSGSLMKEGGKSAITVEAECMYGDFEQAIEHLRLRLIATHNPEEIRGGGLLKYSDLLVRNFRPASETEIKSLERYMCSRFFIDFPDVSEQQRKIETYLQCHFIGNEETSKYDYLMTLRRVIDESTVCLMGHERRQTLNMITVLALRVLGEQNAIPNTANVTCFYQPAPYMTDPVFNSYFIAQAQPPPPPPLVYHPYPLHVHMQTGLV